MAQIFLHILDENARMKNNLLLFLLMIFFSQCSFGQITFQKTYGAASIEYSAFSQETADGGYIICGVTFSFGDGDVYLVKTNQNGDTLWTKTYGGINNDRANSVHQTVDGGYILAGSTFTYGCCDSKGYLIKINANGGINWTKTYEYNFEAISSIKQTTDGGYIMAGLSTIGSNNCYLIKSDSNGTVLWAKTYGGIAKDEASSVQETNDGGYIITGQTNSFGTGASDCLLIKTDVNGNILWSKTYGGISSDYANSVQQTLDGGFIIAGVTQSYGAGSTDCLVIKTDSNGNIFWSKTYGTVNTNNANYIEQTNDGGYIIVGSNDYDVYLIKTKSNGEPVWTKSYGGSGYDVGISVHQTADGGYIIGGWKSDSVSFQNIDFYLIKTDSNGNSGCTETNISTTVTNPAVTVSTPSMIVSNINPGVNNFSTQIGGGCVVTTLCITTDIVSENEEYLFDIYPNPSTGMYTVILKNRMVAKKICVFDLLGTCVWDKECRNDVNTVIDLSCQPKGVYFLEIVSNSERVVKKLVLQ